MILISNVLSQQKNNPVIQKQRIRVCSVCARACVCLCVRGCLSGLGGLYPSALGRKRTFSFFFSTVHSPPVNFDG